MSIHTIKSGIKSTWTWFWMWLRKEPVVITDTRSGQEHIEHWSRHAIWHVFRPAWTHVAFTTNPGCGCRKRLGIWYTIYCSEHAFGILEAETQRNTKEQEEQ